MSLTTAIRDPKCKAVLDPLLPEYTRNLKLSQLVAPTLPGAAHAALVGTAFDYAFRFEIERDAHTHEAPMGCRNGGRVVREHLRA